MNTEQWFSLFRALVMMGGAAAVTFGWLTKEQVDAISDPATLTAVFGGCAAIVTLVVAVRKRSTKNIIATAADLPEVKQVLTDPKTASAVPSDKVQATIR